MSHSTKRGPVVSPRKFLENFDAIWCILAVFDTCKIKLQISSFYIKSFKRCNLLRNVFDSAAKKMYTEIPTFIHGKYFTQLAKKLELCITAVTILYTNAYEIINFSN